MLITHTANSDSKTGRSPLRRILLICGLPVLILMTGTPLARLSKKPAVPTASAPASVESGRGREVRAARLRAAWDTIQRLETESRLSGGALPIASTDLQQLKNALQSSE